VPAAASLWERRRLRAPKKGNGQMSSETQGRWHQAGWATYAGIMLFGGGIVGIVNGVWAFRYSDRRADLVVAERNVELWGLAALIGGAVMLAVGIGVFYGKNWARWSGIGVSLLAVAWAVGWAQIQPMQSLISALIYILVIYGLATNPVATTVDGDG
jgi:hypothetical protein